MSGSARRAERPRVERASPRTEPFCLRCLCPSRIQVRLSPPQAAAPETQPVVGCAEAAAAAAAVCGRRAGGLSGDGAAAAAPVHQRERHLRRCGPGAARPRHPAVGAADRLPAVSSSSTPAASQPWSSDSYGIGFCWTQPLSSVRPTCHPHVAADWYLRSPLCRTCSLVRVPWWNKEKWEVGTVACMPEGTGLGWAEGRTAFSSCYTKLCKGKACFY